MRKTIKDDNVSEIELDSSKPVHSKRKMKKKTKVTILISTCVTALLVVLSVPILMNVLRSEENFKLKKTDLSQNQVSLIEEGSFKALNDVKFPSMDLERTKISQEYIDAVSSFASTIYGAIDKKDEENLNFNFSPFGLYSVLQLLYPMSDNQSVLDEFDALLGLDEQTRKENYLKAFANNFFISDNGTMQLYNGAFYTNKYEPNMSVIDELTSYYCEAFQMDFLNEDDVNKLLKWVDEHLKAERFVTKDFFELDSETAILLFSTLYFKEHWSNPYSTSKTQSYTFHGRNKLVEAEFMQHVYFGEAYIYEDYLSFYDYYTDGYKIKYMVPRSLDKDILDLTKDKNILKEDQEAYKSNVLIDLSVPKFSLDFEIDFTKTLKQVGLNHTCNPFSKAFNHAFVLDNPSDYSFYLRNVKQKNKVEFNEDGSVIRSLTAAIIGPTSVLIKDEIEVKLNQPFIYVIYDSQDLPIYIGHIDNPTL